MFSPMLPRTLLLHRITVLLPQALRAVLLLAFFTPAHSQSTASIEGQVVDQLGAVIANAQITIHNRSTGADRTTSSDEAGRYQFAALPVGEYRIEVTSPGFQTQILDRLTVEVARRITQNFQLLAGDVSEHVTVTSSNGILEASTISFGQVVNQRMVQEIPLNGRYFLDLGLLVAGSVTPPQTGSGSIPVRGTGSFAFNTAGNREESVNYMINGISLNDPAFTSINFQPSISSVKEFKLDNSTPSAEYGQNSGAVVNIATRSGTNEFHGELFEFLRNDAFDARNYFDLTSNGPPSFKRNLFGGDLGGPIFKDRTFFFFSYEGLRHRQDLSLSSVVLSDQERTSATDPVVLRLIELIPPANVIDSSGTSRFIGTATAPVNLDNWTIDISHNLSEKDHLHAYYVFNVRDFLEPSRGTGGNTIPGFGISHKSSRHFFSLNHTHTFGSNVVNEARFGFNRLYANTNPRVQLNPADFGILNGISEPIGLPQLNIAGGGLNFGGPSGLPLGRADTYFVFANTLNLPFRQHSFKVGAEFRRFLSDIFRQPTGSFNFPTVDAFLAGTANSFSVTLGSQSSSITQGALGAFVQDNYKVSSNLMLELGLRYEWNMTPTERFDRFIVFDPSSVSLLRVGTDLDEIYQQNNKNFQPRLGFAWDPFRDGKTVLRGGYALLVDQPTTGIVAPTSANPPLAIPLTFSGPIRLDNAINLARPAGLAPQTVDHGFDNAYLQSWNLNVQHELGADFTVMVGYFGSKGTNLIIRRNINQPVNGLRPFPTLSESSPILPGTPLGNITQVEGTGNSSYNALWITANKRFARGLQFNASYTWSKSLDYNSLNSQGVVVQNSNDLRSNRGLSDFDARHRFVCSSIYDLPFRGNQLVDGWQLAAILQAQSGNPVNVVTSNSNVNGVANTLRPDVSGPIDIVGSVDRWFDTSVFTSVARFGNLGRNVVVGPRFDNVDFSIIKNTKIGERVRIQFRT